MRVVGVNTVSVEVEYVLAVLSGQDARDSKCVGFSCHGSQFLVDDTSRVLVSVGGPQSSSARLLKMEGTYHGKHF